MKSIGLFRSVTIVLSGLLLATVVASAQPPSREAVLATSPRIAIDTPRLRGSVALIGGRIDDLLLVRYRETVDPGSPVVVLLSPVGSERPYYAEFGWLAADGAEAPQPATDARWRQEGAGVLAIDRPVTLVHDDGAGLSFRRTISVDDKYLFTVTDEVHNAGTAPVTLRPYARLVRHGRPPGLGLYLAHEGLIGVLGDLGLRELTYTSLDERKQERFDVINAWLGISDQYWATALLPDPAARLDAWFAALGPPAGGYQAGYRLAPQTIPPGGSGRAQVRLFAGAKEVAVVDGYDASLHLNRFDLLIDWGWSVAFIVKPMFLTVAFLEGFVHNYGVAILLLAVLIQLLFFPLAHKSYAALAQRKAPQPSGAARPPSLIWRRLYVAAQFVIQFSLVKMLFVAVELRHAPFFGWIHDLSAPDPTNIFTLAGWLPFDPAKLPVIGPLLQLGIWPAVMCVAMWGLIRLKPAPADPTQKVVYNAAPVVVGYVFASWAAGLVLYRACNSSLALLHQGWVIRRHGGRVKLLDDVARIAARRKPAPPTGVSPTPGVRAVMRLPRRIRIVRAIRSACRGAFWVAAILLLLGPGSLDGAVTVALVLTLLLAIIAYLVALHIGQTLAGREFASALAGGRERERPLVLYLRSFDIARSSLVGRLRAELGYVVRASVSTVTASLVGDTSAFVDRRYEVEEHLEHAIGLNAMFVAIGDRLASYGAAKITVSDEHWQDMFRRLAEASQLIFMMPGPSQALLWELSQIMGAPALLEKTVFIMPRASRRAVAPAWEKVSAMAAELGVRLPSYSAEGCYFRMRADGQPGETVALEPFTRALRKFVTGPAYTGTIDFAAVMKLA